MRRMYSENQLKTFKKPIDSLVDTNGNPRFIEGEGTPIEKEGIETVYCKWSLSGTHLMCVYAGNMDEDTELTNNLTLASFDFESYILDKLTPLFINLLLRATVTLYASDYSGQTIQINVVKTATGVAFQSATNYTINANRNFRIQFDALIDAE